MNWGEMKAQMEADATKARDAIELEKRATLAIPMYPEFQDAHEFLCDADRTKPVGSEGCSCRAGVEIQRLQKVLRKIEDAARAKAWCKMPNKFTQSFHAVLAEIHDRAWAGIYGGAAHKCSFCGGISEDSSEGFHDPDCPTVQPCDEYGAA